LLAACPRWLEKLPIAMNERGISRSMRRQKMLLYLLGRQEKRQMSPKL
jgi:hypothetical protein